MVDTHGWIMGSPRYWSWYTSKLPDVKFVTCGYLTQAKNNSLVLESHSKIELLQPNPFVPRFEQGRAMSVSRDEKRVL